MSLEWIEVESSKDLPVGTWLVELENERHPYEVAYVHPNITTIGNCFEFDMNRVIRYRPIPE